MSQSDIPRLYTAIAEWLSCMLYIAHLSRPTHKLRYYALCLGFLFGQIILHLIAGILPILFWVPGMLAALLLMLAFFRCTTTISLPDQICYTMRAFIIAEFFASLEWQLHTYYLQGRIHTWLACLLCISVYFTVLFLCTLVHRFLFRDPVLGASKRETLNTCIIAIMIFIASNFSYLDIESPFRGTVLEEIFYVRTLIDFCGIIILLLEQEQHIASDARLELRTMDFVLHQQYDQYRQSRDSIDLINRKYHDLKHQIHVIRSEQIPEKRESYLSDLESDIRVFQSQFHTGNDILDTILSGKSLSCTEREIRMQAIVDGELVSFLEPMDLCSLFGNALDNAIEYLSTVPEPEKRLLIVNVCRQNDFVLIRFENYCPETLVYENQLPKTTKDNHGYHGFGVKSIRYISEKYGGTCVLRQERDWFKIHILIPMK